MAEIMPNRVRLLRKQAGLTQEQLAELCGTTHPTIQRIESCEQDLKSKWIVLISAALKVHPGELFEPMPYDDKPEVAEAVKLARELTPEERRYWLRTGRALAAQPENTAA